MNVPKEYEVEGLNANNYSKLNATTEAVEYITPNGTTFALARDFMGIQICKNGCFWPPPFMSFPNMKAAVTCLRIETKAAIAFFDEVANKQEERRCEKELKRDKTKSANSNGKAN